MENQSCSFIVQKCLSNEDNLKITDVRASLLHCISDLELVMSHVDYNDINKIHLYSRLSVLRQYLSDVAFIISFITPNNN